MDLMSIEITSDVLRLRPIAIGDKHVIFKEFNENIITYMYPPTPEDIEETEDFIDTSILLMKKGINIQLVIEHNQTKEFLGCVGLHRVDKKNPEFGVWIKSEAHGNGYGIKAIHMLYNFAVENFEFDYFLYPVAKQNVASRKIPESLSGVIKKEENVTTPIGKVLNVVEYHIPFRKENT